MPEKTIWRTLVEPILRTNNLKFSYPSQDPEPTNFDVVMVEREIDWRIENYGVDLFDLLAKLKQGITEGPTHGGAPLDLRKLFSGFLDWCVREKKLRAFLRCLAENDLVQRLVGAPTDHGNNRRGAVNPSATTQTGLASWHDLIQRYPLFVLFKAMRDGRLKPLHSQTGAALSLPWDLLEYFAIFKSTENPEKDKEVMRRLEELVDSEPLLNGLPPDKLIEEYSRLENAVFSASEVDQAFSQEPSADESATIQEAPAREKKDSLSHTEKAVRVIQSKWFHERRTFERFVKLYLKGKVARPSKAETMRAAREKYEDLNEVPSKTMMHWVDKMYRTINTQ